MSSPQSPWWRPLTIIQMVETGQAILQPYLESSRDENWWLHIPVMPSLHQCWCHSGLSLTYPTVPGEVVGIHGCQLIEEGFDTCIIPPFFWPLSLQRSFSFINLLTLTNPKNPLSLFPLTIALKHLVLTYEDMKIRKAKFYFNSVHVKNKSTLFISFLEKTNFFFNLSYVKI